MHITLVFGWASPEIIGIIVVGALLLFGAERLPKLARSAGQAKKEFMVGQAEADEAATRVREEARLRAETAHRDPMEDLPENTGIGQQVPPPTPGGGTQSG
jgi:sec-independent protein translocase protein TatA